MAKDASKSSTHAWGWPPLVALPITAIVCGRRLPPWAFMWTLSFAIYFSLKWQTWWRSRTKIAHPAWRSPAYLLAWPGMDADTFLDPNQHLATPAPSAWLSAVTKTTAGAVLLWVIARTVSAHPLIQGWVGMAGLILILHFGLFQIVALAWQSVGVAATPIMQSPLRSTSLAEFWGKRWNLGFRQLAHELIFRPTYRSLGPAAASFLVFVVSGLIHDLVISLPAHAGYGLPTLYFVIQGLGVMIERSSLGKSAGLAQGIRGWCFSMAFLVAPVFWLFHPWFVMRVILPFMRAIRAL